MNKIYIIYDYNFVPFFYLESIIINEIWLLKHGICNYDIVETPLDLDHFEKLCYGDFDINLYLKNNR